MNSAKIGDSGTGAFEALLLGSPILLPTQARRTSIRFRSNETSAHCNPSASLIRSPVATWPFQPHWVANGGLILVNAVLREIAATAQRVVSPKFKFPGKRLGSREMRMALDLDAGAQRGAGIVLHRPEQRGALRQRVTLDAQSRSLAVDDTEQPVDMLAPHRCHGPRLRVGHEKAGILYQLTVCFGQVAHRGPP